MKAASPRVPPVRPLWNEVEMGTDLTTPKGDKNASEGEAAITGATRAAVRKLGQELGIPAAQLPLENFSFLTKVRVRTTFCVCCVFGLSLPSFLFWCVGEHFFYCLFILCECWRRVSNRYVVRGV